MTAGTVMHGSQLSLTVWFWAAYLMATHSNGISARQLWQQLGLGSYKSAWLLCAKLRRAMVNPARDPLSGLVEVDETQISYRTKDDPPAGGGGRKGEGKMQVAAAVELQGKGPGRVRLAVIKDASATSLRVFIKTSVANGATTQDRRLVRLSRRAGLTTTPCRRQHGRPYHLAVGPSHLLQPQDMGAGRLSRLAQTTSSGIPRRVHLQVQSPATPPCSVPHPARHRPHYQTRNIQDADRSGSIGTSLMGDRNNRRLIHNT